MSMPGSFIVTSNRFRFVVFCCSSIDAAVVLVSKVPNPEPFDMSCDKTVSEKNTMSSLYGKLTAGGKPPWVLKGAMVHVKSNLCIPFKILALG